MNILLNILDIPVDTHAFVGDLVHKLATGRHAGGRIKFEASFVFEYTK